MARTARYPSLQLVEPGGPAARHIPAEAGAEAFRLFQTMADPVIVARLDYTVVFLNQAAAELLEIDPTEADGMSLHGIFTEQVRCHHADINAAMIKGGGRVSSMRVEVTGVRGRMTPALMSVDPVQLKGQSYLLASFKDNSEVEKLTFSDPLTGVYNRGYQDQLAASLYSQLSRGQISGLSVLFLDIDFFGEFNKRHGHRFGDTVLRAVADCMRDTARCGDSVCRYGGEEFAVFLPGTDYPGALAFAERLRKRIAELELIHPDSFTRHGVTASIGVATHGAGQVGTADQLIGEANHACLTAKRQGRNQVIGFDDNE